MAEPISALVAYYGKANPGLPTVHSNPDNRPGYLQRTVDSLRPLVGTGPIVLGVHADDGTVPEIPDTYRVGFHCAPHFVPATLLRWAQANMDWFPGNIYYTEADQVLHYTTPDVFSVVACDTYLVPHRVAKLGQHGEARGFGPTVDRGGELWELDNGQPEGDGFYHPHADDFEINRCLQYGAAFLCTQELLAKTTFVDSFPDRPLEHAGGFDISAAGYAIKTSFWQEFFVEHLSGYEINERTGGRA